jgi:hypothetical protein
MIKKKRAFIVFGEIFKCLLSHCKLAYVKEIKKKKKRRASDIKQT